MSAKWERSRAWGRGRLSGPLSPLRWALDALSSIPFAMIMLGVVALWGVLGTIPIGWTGLAGADLPDNALLRHHAAFDLTEGEWYRLWPFQLALALFVLNMVVATIRRIEFRWVNLGVLSVHAGIVLFALGGWTYSILKREGVMLLPITDGGVYTQREVSWFSDMTEPAVLVRQAGEPDRVIPLEGLARYWDAEIQESMMVVTEQRLRTLQYFAGKTETRVRAGEVESRDACWWVFAQSIGASQPVTGVETIKGIVSADPTLQPFVLPGGPVVVMTPDDSHEWWDALLNRDAPTQTVLVLGNEQAVILDPALPPQRFMDIESGATFHFPNGYIVVLGPKFPYTLANKVGMYPDSRPETPDRHGGIDHSAIQVEYVDPIGTPRTIWLPFSEFGDDSTLVDERTSLAFTLMRHTLPDAWVRAESFAVEQRPPESLRRGLHLADDFIADYIVDITIDDARGRSAHTVRLNRPATLRARPDSGHWTDRLASLLGATRYSLSVSGWDETGYFTSKPRYVVLTVGNTPGTDLVAVGAVLFALGTPWAFFVKPWVLRRRAAADGIDPISQSAGPTHA